MATHVADPGLVRCKGRGLKFGYVGRSIESTLDTRRAGPGELTVHCPGPVADRPAYCELVDHRDGTFTLRLRAQDVGQHHLNVLYDNIHVPGSPFPLRVSGASLLKVSGSGLQDGLLARYQPQFTIDTSEAGKGEIKVEIGGPRGAFNIHTKAEGKLLHCSYHVREPGQYIINVTWCGDPAPDSPYHVFIWRTEEELRRYLIVRQQVSASKGRSSLATGRTGQPGTVAR